MSEQLVVPSGSDPETFRVHLETLWRLVDAETAKTDTLERKATAIASLSGIVLAINAALGLDEVRLHGGLPLILFLLSLLLLIGGVGGAAIAMRPAGRRTLADEEIASFESEGKLRVTPNAARLWTISVLIHRVQQERRVAKSKSEWVQRAFGLFFCGLLLVALEVSVLAAKLGS